MFKFLLFARRLFIKLFLPLLRKMWNLYLRLYPWQAKGYIPVDVSKPMPSGADKVMESCCQALEKNKIPYFLSWGTALGLYREGRLIPHDTDIDIDMVDCQDYGAVHKALTGARMRLARRVFFKKRIQQLVYLSKTGIVFDICFWTTKRRIFKGKVLVSYSEPHYILKLPHKLIKNTAYIKYKNKQYPTYYPIESYLATVYGSDWKTPKTSKGDWKEDCMIISKLPEPIFKFLSKIALLYRKYIKPKTGSQYQIPEQFFKLNRKFWPSIPRYKSFFLVEFLIKDHEYYNVHLITARELAEILKAQPVALLPLHEDKNLTKLVKSYGIENILYLEDFTPSKKLRLWLMFYSVALWLTRRTKQQLLNLRYKNTLIGHFIYDSYLKSTGYGTVKVNDFQYTKFIYSALKSYHKYIQIFNAKKYQLYFGSEQAYIVGGIPSVVAVSQNIKVFFRKFGPNRVSYKTYTKQQDLDLYPGHASASDFEFQLIHNQKYALEWANNYLKNLFQGNIEPFDWNAKNAFKNSKKLTYEKRKKLFNNQYRYHVFIFSHVFVDAVHGYRENIFPDYEIWLRKTLTIAKKRQDTLWIVKSHPCEKYYYTKTKTIDVCREFSSYKNIKIFPENTSTASLINYIDAIVTVRGTPIIEYSGVGIPVITAGRSRFDQGKFCIMPKNKQEYKDTLMNTEFNRLPEDKVNRAKIYLYLNHRLNRTDMPLLSTIPFDSAFIKPEKIYNHLIKTLPNSSYQEITSNSYKKYLIKKLFPNDENVPT